MRILIVRACAVGDFVLNLPALRALAAKHPEARFTLVGYPSTLILARTFIPVEDVHSIEVRPWAELFLHPIENLRFDAAYVWMKDPTVAQNLKDSGIPSVFHADPFPRSGHAAQHLLDTLGVEAPDLPDFWIPGSPRILLHPGSGSPTKVWPGFRLLAETLSDVAIIIGPCETGFTTPHARLEGLSLPDIAREISNCRLFVGNDSGITHIAAYWGAPTVALFGPTDPEIWRPVGRRVRILKRPSLADISVEEVRESAR